MAEQFVQVAPDSTGAKIRTRERVIGANTVEEQYVITLNDDRVKTFVGVAGSPLIPGSAATPQNLASIENTTGSSVLVAVRKLEVLCISTAAQTVRNPHYHLTRIGTVPTGGQAVTKQGTRSGDTSSGNVAVRFAANADGTHTAITATAGALGTRMRTGFAERWHTLVGHGEFSRQMLIDPVLDEPLELAANQHLLLQVLVATAADNIAARFFGINVAWDEFTRP